MYYWYQTQVWSSYNGGIIERERERERGEGIVVNDFMCYKYLTLLLYIPETE